MSNRAIDEETCTEWRKAYKSGKSSTDIAKKGEWSKSAILYHLRGDCDHNGSIEPIDLEASSLSENECQRIRKKANQGQNPSELASDMGISFDAVVAHATGDCGHRNTGLTLTRKEFYDRIPVSKGNCAQIRARVHETGSLRPVAEELPWEYPTIARHANGECGHDNVSVPPRKKDERSDRIPHDRCTKVREAYFGNSNKIISELADEFDSTSTTIEKHVKFECNHPPSDTIQSLVESVGLDSYIENEDTTDLSNEFDEVLASIDPSVPENEAKESAGSNEDENSPEQTQKRTENNEEATSDSNSTSGSKSTPKKQDNSIMKTNIPFESSEIDAYTYVITGAVDGWTRDELRGAIEHIGGNTTESVSSNTDYLIVGENPGKRKREDANKHGVPQLSADAFLNKVDSELPLCFEIDSILLTLANATVEQEDWDSLDDLVTNALRTLFKQDLDGKAPEFTPSERIETNPVYLSISSNVRQFLTVYAGDGKDTSESDIIETALRTELDVSKTKDDVPELELSSDVTLLLTWFVERSERYETADECIKSLITSKISHQTSIDPD